ncbi:MAG: permease [Candidatus Eremiobacteraeota bacterium]|nr:permease [Candidatus Eremiobacteraeota bacterium]
MEAIGSALLRGLGTTASFFWDSLYGLIFGFLISAIAQTVFSRGAMERALGPNLRGVLTGAAFGIVASACSYGAAAAARGFYQKGADARAAFAFLISSTNMNVAILIMIWAMLSWQFAAAEFFGGIVIIAIVTIGLSLVFRGDALRAGDEAASAGSTISECLQCGMDGETEHAVAYDGRTYLFCGARHEAGFRAAPAGVLAASRAEDEAPPGLGALRRAATWRAVFDTLLADVEMLRSELILGFVIAGFAAALVPPAWLAGTLRAIGSVPFAGYPLLLVAGLALAVVTFVCSMGNVPIARFLAMAGIPLGANTTFVYGDLLIPPLVAIYRKSFPPRLVWAFLALFVVGALVAGALVDVAFGRSIGAAHVMGSMAASNRFTLWSNVVALAALGAVAAVARRRGDYERLAA